MEGRETEERGGGARVEMGENREEGWGEVTGEDEL